MSYLRGGDLFMFGSAIHLRLAISMGMVEFDSATHPFGPLPLQDPLPEEDFPGDGAWGGSDFDYVTQEMALEAEWNDRVLAVRLADEARHAAFVANVEDIRRRRS